MRSRHEIEMASLNKSVTLGEYTIISVLLDIRELLLEKEGKETE